MAVTLTASAYNMPARNFVGGVNSITARLVNSTVTMSASANATVLFLCKIPANATIIGIREEHSSGAASCPIDLGIKINGAVNLSAFASQLTQQAVNVAAAMKLPYRCSITDTQATQYAVIQGGVTPGTNTAALDCRITVFYSMDKEEIADSIA